MTIHTTFNLNNTHTYKTKTFSLDAINRLTALIYINNFYISTTKGMISKRQFFCDITNPQKWESMFYVNVILASPKKQKLPPVYKL